MHARWPKTQNDLTALQHAETAFKVAPTHSVYIPSADLDLTFLLRAYKSVDCPCQPGQMTAKSMKANAEELKPRKSPEGPC